MPSYFRDNVSETMCLVQYFDNGSKVSLATSEKISLVQYL